MKVLKIGPSLIYRKVNNNLKNIISTYKDKCFIHKKKQFFITTPIVAYMPINWNRMKEEATKSYHPYIDSVNATRKEFEKRNLPFNENYVNQFSGSINERGQSVLSNFDNNKEYFQKANLDFSVEYIDKSTGNLNLSGMRIKNNYEHSCKLLDDAGIKYNDALIDDRTGNLTQKANKMLNSTTFKGAPEDIDESSVDMDFKLQADVAELKELDTGLCPELQEIYDAPPLVTTDDVIESIFDTLPEGVDWDDWDLWSILQQIAQEIIGLEGD